MKWYMIDCFSQGIVLKYLNILNDNNVSPNNIKIVNTYIYYYHRKDLFK